MKDLIGRVKPEITIRQEMKLAGVNIDTITGLCSFENQGWIALPLIGAAGGVLLIWNSELVDVELSWVDSFSVTVVVALCGDSQKWMVISVYGPSAGGQLFDDFINELEEIRGRKELHGVLGEILTRFYLLMSRIRQQGELGGWILSGTSLTIMSLLMCLYYVLVSPGPIFRTTLP